jgi:hypothetical protein
MNDHLWHGFYALGVQYAQSVRDAPERTHPDAIRDAVREHIAAHDLLEGSFDTQELHHAFALGVNDTLDNQRLP